MKKIIGLVALVLIAIMGFAIYQLLNRPLALQSASQGLFGLSSARPEPTTPANRGHESAPPPPRGQVTGTNPPAGTTDEPPRVRTVTIRPDGAVIEDGRPASTANAPPFPEGSFAVSVASQKTEADALASYRTLQSKYPAVLGDREPIIRRADLGDRGIAYRAQIGPFATADLANAFCLSLKDAGGQCVVLKN